jgi:hypothetical protein
VDDLLILIHAKLQIIDEAKYCTGEDRPDIDLLFAYYLAASLCD